MPPKEKSALSTLNSEKASNPYTNKTDTKYKAKTLTIDEEEVTSPNILNVEMKDSDIFDFKN